MKDHCTYEIPKGILAEHQREILNRHLCSLFLPVSFWETEDKITVVVDETGWMPLEAATGITVSEALALLCALVKGWEEAEDRYLMPETLCWDAASFYVPVHRRKQIASHGGVCLAVPYMAWKASAGCSRSQAVEQLGGLLLTQIPRQERGYLQRALSLLVENRYGGTYSLRSLERLKREIHRQEGVASDVAQFFRTTAEERPAKG